MKSSHFLWPEAKIARALLQAARFATTAKVEAKLAEMFHGGVPVLFSSGRAALTHALLIGGLARGDKVGVFPFASHCVVDAVSRVATPTDARNGSRLNLVFQQWGFIQYHNLSGHDVEDCVDSLLVPGGKLFPGGGGFEIWSLPKILGTTGGGVLWCRSVDTAIALRRVRDSRTRASLLWGLRLLGRYSALLHAFWQGAEPAQGLPSRFQMGEILLALDAWNEVVADRRKKFDIAWPSAPSWLAKPPDRFPCVVPVELSDNVNGESLALQAGISAGQRVIERASASGHFELVRVLPMPIHQDVTIARLRAMLDFVAPYVRRDA